MNSIYIKTMTVMAIFSLLVPISCATLNPNATPIENIKCNVQKSLADGMTVAISGMLKCKNSEAVRISLQTMLGNTHLCEVPVKSRHKKFRGPIGNIACPAAINATIGFLSNSVPKEWECAPAESVPISAIATVAEIACEAAIPL